MRDYQVVPRRWATSWRRGEAPLPGGAHLERAERLTTGPFYGRSDWQQSGELEIVLSYVLCAARKANTKKNSGRRGVRQDDSPPTASHHEHPPETSLPSRLTQCRRHVARRRSSIVITGNGRGRSLPAVTSCDVGPCGPYRYRKFFQIPAAAGLHLMAPHSSPSACSKKRTGEASSLLAEYFTPNARDRRRRIMR